MFFLGLFSSFVPYIILLVGYLICIISFSSTKNTAESTFENNEETQKIIQVNKPEQKPNYNAKTFDYQDFYAIGYTKCSIGSQFAYLFYNNQYFKKIFPEPLAHHLVEDSFINIPPPSFLL